VATYSSGTTLFDHGDWLGTVRVLSTVSGAPYQTCSSLPFGDAQSCAGGSGYQLLFTGVEHDTESNLEHARFRQYSSAQGRWISPDPAGPGVVSVTNPQTWDQYSYVMNNPLTYLDPLGTDGCPYDACVIATFPDDGDGGGGGGSGQGYLPEVPPADDGGQGHGGSSGSGTGADRLYQAEAEALNALLNNVDCSQAIDGGTGIAASTLEANLAAENPTTNPSDLEYQSFGTITMGNMPPNEGGHTVNEYNLNGMVNGVLTHMGFSSTITMNSDPNGYFLNPGGFGGVFTTPSGMGTGYSNQIFQTIEVLHEMGHGSSFYGAPSAIALDGGSPPTSVQNTQTVETNCYPQGDFGGNQGPVGQAPAVVPANTGRRKQF